VIPRPAHRRRRLRLRIRRPIPYWLAAGALVVLTVSTVARVTSAAAEERARWGAAVDDVVAVHDLEPGDAIGADDVELRRLPAALVASDALHELVDGAVTSAWTAAGEPLLSSRLAPAGLSPTAALLPPGTRGVAIPLGVAPLPVVAGDRVDVLATLDTSTVVVARRALVIAGGVCGVTVAVDESAASDVASAVVVASVTLVLSGAR
jgi:Flp pilus assembly protein CpaB